jgi:hypothetical protein
MHLVRLEQLAYCNMPNDVVKVARLKRKISRDFTEMTMTR